MRCAGARCDARSSPCGGEGWRRCRSTLAQRWRCATTGPADGTAPSLTASATSGPSTSNPLLLLLLCAVVALRVKIIFHYTNPYPITNLIPLPFFSYHFFSYHSFHRSTWPMKNLSSWTDSSSLNWFIILDGFIILFISLPWLSDRREHPNIIPLFQVNYKVSQSSVSLKGFLKPSETGDNIRVTTISWFLEFSWIVSLISWSVIMIAVSTLILSPFRRCFTKPLRGWGSWTLLFSPSEWWIILGCLRFLDKISW